MNTEQRLVDVEIKLSYTEDLLDELNLVIYRQQQQIDALVRQVTTMQQQQAPDAGAGPRSPQNEPPPHY